MLPCLRTLPASHWSGFRRLQGIAGLVCLLTLSVGAFRCAADAPAPVGSVTKIESIQLEIDAQSQRLKTLLASADAYEKERDGAVRQAFGLLAVLGQALAEVDGGDKHAISGPMLRDAALKFARKGDLAAAQAVFKGVEAALAGEKQEAAERDHPWNKLIGMHPMMEELNARQSTILKALRRPRGTPEEALNADTWALLALAMQADTHEVKNPDDLPEWNRMAVEFREASTQLAAALRAKDATAGRKWFDTATALCTQCHDKFNHE